MSRPQYDDGLDDDGFPIEVVPFPRYRHGSEEGAGDQPIETIGKVFICRMLETIALGAAVSLHTESPIETMLAVAILRLWPSIELCPYGVAPGGGWSLIPQYVWGKYRVDLALRKPDGSLIFIECDGHDFHSSPEQIERDQVREHLMIEAGYPVIRFTGSKINQSPDACALRLNHFFGPDA